MKGLAVFKMLKPSKTYCWVAKFGSGVTSSFCAGYILLAERANRSRELSFVFVQVQMTAVFGI